MPFTIPPFVAFPGSLVPMPSRERGDQTAAILAGEEPDQYCGVELDWSAVGQCQLVDVGQRTVKPFTRITMIDYDNSQSTTDCQLLFTDTQLTVTIPAGEVGRCFAPTSGVRFYANSVQASLLTDTCRLSLLNYPSSPYSISRTEFNAAVSANLINVAGNGTTQLIPSTVSGIIQSLHVGQYFVASGAVAGTATVTFRDGTGAVVAAIGLSAPVNSQIPSGPALEIDDYNVRFSQGLQAQVIVGGTALAGGAIYTNVGYRTPA